MKSTLRNQLLHCSIVLALAFLANNLHAAENPVSKLWPFGKSKVATPALPSPVSAPKKSTAKSLLSGPSRLMSKAGEQTHVAMDKTKSGFKNVQSFGRSLNPFAKKATPKPAKPSLFDRMFTKKPEPSGPSTVDEFISMDRPGF